MCKLVARSGHHYSWPICISLNGILGLIDGLSLQWRHNELDGVPNHQPHDSLRNADQGKPKSSASLAFVRGSHRWPVNSPHKGPVTRKMFPFDDVILCRIQYISWNTHIVVMIYFVLDTLRDRFMWSIYHFSSWQLEWHWAKVVWWLLQVH